eukprot:scaffold189639_cov14-Tisochrysis_lutea.AAC.1
MGKGSCLHFGAVCFGGPVRWQSSVPSNWIGDMLAEVRVVNFTAVPIGGCLAWGISGKLRAAVLLLHMLYL